MLITHRDDRTWQHWALWSAIAVYLGGSFALTHSDYSMWNVAGALVLSVTTTFLVVLARTVWAPVLAHATSNTFALAAYPL